MKKLLLVAIFLSFIFSGCYGDNSIEKPDLQKQEDLYIWDFGKVKAGKVMKHTFTLRNETGKRQKITQINTSCGCTASKLEKKELAPGEDTKIEVAFNSKGYSGKIQQFIYVHTDNLDKPVIRYIIKAEVEK